MQKVSVWSGSQGTNITVFWIWLRDPSLYLLRQLNSSTGEIYELCGLTLVLHVIYFRNLFYKSETEVRKYL